MFVFEAKNHITQETDSITGKSVIEICGEILNYFNGKQCVEGDYTVIFIDKNGKTLLEILESSLKYAVFGINDGDSLIESKESIIKNEAGKFMSMIHSDIDIIEFTNPIRCGEVYWDADYFEEVEDKAEDEEDEEEEENAKYAEDANSNINQ